MGVRKGKLIVDKSLGKLRSKHSLQFTHLPMLREDREAEGHSDRQDEDGVEDGQHDQDFPEDICFR